MTQEEKELSQEEKELLLVDLCARLTHGVICQVDDGAAGLNDGKLVEIDISKELVRFDVDYYWDAYIDDVKPYLRPMSSMTLEELGEYRRFGDHIRDAECKIHIANYEQIDWFNTHHFDYRGLIPKGLAIEAPEGMYLN